MFYISLWFLIRNNKNIYMKRILSSTKDTIQVMYYLHREPHVNPFQIVLPDKSCFQKTMRNIQPIFLFQFLSSLLGGSGLNFIQARHLVHLPIFHMALDLLVISSTEFYYIHILSSCFIIRHKMVTANVKKKSLCVNAFATATSYEVLK